jgi:hypothetical protein
MMSEKTHVPGKPEITPEQREALSRLRKAYYAAFSTPAGKEVLEHLIHEFQEQEGLRTDGQGRIDPSWPLVVEGRRNVIRHIRMMMKLGEKERAGGAERTKVNVKK